MTSEADRTATPEITREEIEALLKLADAATPGPWRSDRSKLPTDGEYDYAISAPGAPVLAEVFGRTSDGGHPPARENATFIAAANPAVLKALCALALKAKDMEPRPELVLAYCDDWQGLYVNGSLKTEGHSVRVDDMAEALGLSFSLREVPQAWAEARGNFPDDITSLPEPKE